MLKKIDINELFPSIDREMFGSLAVPSAMHGYSICIEYAKKWFFSKIPESYFKTIYIESRYTLDEFKKYPNITSQVGRSNPALSITPNIDSTYNRDFVDFTPNMMGIDGFIRKSRFEMPFFEDPGRHLRLFMTMKAIQVSFAFKVRIDSKAQQLDLRDLMSIAYKSGATMGEYIDVDYHIPYAMILNLAKDAGFTIVDNKIQDIMEFVHYLNSNSRFPITYKLRGVNGRHEFFIRATNQYIHTRTGDIDRDDGERKEHLETNFNIDMATTVTFPVPHFFMYYSEIKHDVVPNNLGPADEQSIGIYALNLTNMPTVDDNGWMLYMTTDVLEENKTTPLHIDNIMKLFDSINGEKTDIQKIVEWNNDHAINSNIFINIKLFNNGKEYKSKINWKTGEFNTFEKLEWDKSVMGIYVNRSYLNEQLIELEKYYKDRVN